MPLRLHSGGRSRARLGALFGGDAELGDRVWRRGVHIGASIVLVYYLIPPGFFVVLSNEVVLLLALAVVLALEVLRHLAGLELPTIRPREARRVASFAFYAVALVVAVLVFRRPIAAAVIVGAAIVDPLVGELRLRWSSPTGLILVPWAAYVGLAVVALEAVGRWALPAAFLSAGIAGGIAVAVERPKILWLDDDLAMTLVPGIALTLLVLAWPGLPGWG